MAVGDELDDRAWNRLVMPETAKLIAQARQDLAVFGPLTFIGAQEGDYEVGAIEEVLSEGTIDLHGVRVIVQKIRYRSIGPRAQKRE